MTTKNIEGLLGPQVGYVEIVNHLTQEIIDEKAKSPSKYQPLRPSASGKCERELGFEFMEYKGYAAYPKESNTPEVQRLLNFGYSVENHVLYEFQNAFKRAAKPIEIKYKQQTLMFFKLPDGTQVEGNIDMVLVSEKYKCVADVKSKKEKFSSWFKSSWDELAEKFFKMKSIVKFGEESYWVSDLDAFLKELNDPFFAANFYQLNLYFYDIHQFLRDKGVDHAAIFQYSKNDSRIREIRFRPSETVYEYVKAKFVNVVDVIEKTKNPLELPREFVLGSVKCAFCPFREKCWPEDDAMKAFFKTLPPKQWPKDIDRLPEELQGKLLELFTQYQSLTATTEQLNVVEKEIILMLDKAKTNKVKLPDGTVYRVKHLKSGGSGGKGQLVLRRDKL